MRRNQNKKWTSLDGKYSAINIFRINETKKKKMHERFLFTDYMAEMAGFGVIKKKGGKGRGKKKRPSNAKKMKEILQEGKKFSKIFMNKRKKK